MHLHSGQEEYERLRPMSYSKSHVILIAFAIDTPDSLDNVTVKVRDSTSIRNYVRKVDFEFASVRA